MIALMWRALLREHAPDLAAIFVLGVLHEATDTHLPVVKRYIWTDDRTLWMPFQQREIVSNWALWITAFIVPLAIVVLISALRFPRAAEASVGVPNAEPGTPGMQDALAPSAGAASRAHWRKQTALAIIGLSIATLLACDISITIKALVGRPRPDFIARCALGGLDPALLLKGERPADAIPLAITASDCAGDAALVEEGLKSFPSGHAAATFAGCVYAALVVAQHGGLFPSLPSPPCVHGRSHWVLAATAPMMLALYTALSRHVDNRHRLSDILAGSLLGVLLGVLCHRIYLWPRF